MQATAAAQSTRFKSRGLVFNLVAADFNNGNWDNRASTGAFSSTVNADFAAVGVAPTKISDAGGRPGVDGVLFNGGRMQTVNSPALISGTTLGFGGIYGFSDFSLEVWYYSDGREVGGELPLLQWGA